jgi:hypothetical protein
LLIASRLTDLESSSRRSQGVFAQKITKDTKTEFGLALAVNL